MAKLRTRWLVRERRANAVVTWTLLALATAAGTSALLDGRPIRAVGIGLLVVVAAVPSRPPGTWQRAFVWPLVFVVTLPAHVVAVGPGAVADVAASVTLATFALAVVVDLHLVTAVRMSTGFSAFFVVVATAGFAGFWAVSAWVAHRLFETPFVATGDELMLQLSVKLAAGLVVGVGFELFARRKLPVVEEPAGGPSS